MKLKVLVFIISFLSSLVINAQFVRVEGIRVGLDPVRSVSYLFQEKNKKHSFYLNTLEGYLEVLCFNKVSVVSEFGYSKNHVMKSFGEFDYLSRGKFVKLGLDFDLSDKDERLKTYIGWRVCLNSYKEHADLTFRSTYFDSEYQKDFGLQTKSHLWGEILLAGKYKINKNTQNGLYVGASIRIKMDKLLKFESYPSVIVPGYGFFSSYSAGLSFSLFYHFQVRRSALKEIKYKKFIGEKNKI